MARDLEDYRLRITGRNDVTYLIRKGGKTLYFSGGETPLALSNLVQDKAAETRFALEDAPNGNRAASALRIALATVWNNNPTKTPKVEVL